MFCEKLSNSVFAVSLRACIFFMFFIPAVCNSGKCVV